MRKAVVRCQMNHNLNTCVSHIMTRVKYPLRVTLSSLVLNRLKTDFSFQCSRFLEEHGLIVRFPGLNLLSWKEQHEDKIEPGEVLE